MLFFFILLHSCCSKMSWAWWRYNSQSSFFFTRRSQIHPKEIFSVLCFAFFLRLFFFHFTEYEFSWLNCTLSIKIIIFHWFSHPNLCDDYDYFLFYTFLLPFSWLVMELSSKFRKLQKTAESSKKFPKDNEFFD